MDRTVCCVIGRRAELTGGTVGGGVLTRGIPLPKLLPGIYDSVISGHGTGISPAQMIIIGQSMLSFIENLGELDDAAHRQSDEVLEILHVFSKLFERMLKVNFQSPDSNGFQEIISKVWDVYKKGFVNFSSTSIPSQLLQEFPDRFEETIIEAFTHFNQNENEEERIQDHFTTISGGDSYTFNFTLGYLENIFKSSDYHPSVIKFSKEFLLKVQKSKGFGPYLNLFRNEYYPLITFCTQLESKDIQFFNTNSRIREQMLILIENLYKIHHDQDQNHTSSNTVRKHNIPSVSFILSIIPYPDIPTFLSKSKENIKLQNYPSVWKVTNLKL